jgi:hypothetical protein
MATATEDEVIRKLQERATRGDLTGIDVTYRVTGGAPAEQVVDEEMQLSGPGLVRARGRTRSDALLESSESLTTPEMTQLLLELGSAASELIPRSEARFIPDTVVGQISVRIDGQEATFFFLPDEGQAEQHGKALSPKAAGAVGSLVRLHKRILHL